MCQKGHGTRRRGFAARSMYGEPDEEEEKEEEKDMTKNDITGMDIVSKAATDEFRSGWDLIWGKKSDSDRSSDILPDGEDDVRHDTDAHSGAQ